MINITLIAIIYLMCYWISDFFQAGAAVFKML